MLAIKTHHLLEGGRAAMLSPEKRKRLISDAGALGIRPFDANLVIAIVQDQARMGLAPKGSDFHARLSLVREPGPRTMPTWLVAMICSAILGLFFIYMAARWISWSG